MKKTLMIVWNITQRANFHIMHITKAKKGEQKAYLNIQCLKNSEPKVWNGSVDKGFSVWCLTIPDQRLKWKSEVLLPPHSRDPSHGASLLHRCMNDDDGDDGGGDDDSNND